MVKTPSPFHVVARWREIHAQHRINDADVRKTKKSTVGEPLINKDSRLHGATSKNHKKHFHIHSGNNNRCEHMHP